MKTTTRQPLPTGRMPERCEAEALHIHEHRCAFIRRMGTKWQLHPGYVPDPRHANSPDIYIAARLAYLAEIARLAAADRERRPAFQRAQGVRAALGVMT